MKAKEIWVIVPLSRPHCLINVINNFTQQNFDNKKIVIVENGDAVGCCKKYHFEPDLLLVSENHQALAKNKAIDALKDKDAEFWVCFDDDDYYAKNYLLECAECSDKAEIIGKHNIFMKTTDNRLWLLQDFKENQFTDAVHGPTISAWVKDTIVDFPNTGEWGEDLAFISDMQAEGARCWSSSRWNFLFQRHKNHKHTWIADDYQISQCWHYSHSKNNDSIVTEYNVSMCDAQKIVARELPIPFGTKILMKQFKNEDFPSYNLARKHAGDMDDWVKKELKSYEFDIKQP